MWKRERGMDKLQWGNRKRLRCVKVKSSVLTEKSDDKKKITSRVDRRVVTAHDEEPPHRIHRDLGMNRYNAGSEGRRIMGLSSPEKEDRYYTTRGSVGLDDSSKILMEPREEKRSNKAVWPRLYLALSSKEKEEDFMAMKGCKLPQRPKKRAKLVQKSLLFVSPGAWLSDLCQERYEVREKKTSKKRPRGLKAMGSMDSDSD